MNIKRQKKAIKFGKGRVVGYREGRHIVSIKDNKF